MWNKRENLEKLEKVDWDFIGSSTLPSSVHSLHWYPGKLLPQISNYLISLLSNKDDLVFDPFCGTGTVGIEALGLGRRTWQSDICRAGILVAQGKLSILFGKPIASILENICESFFSSENIFCSGEFAHKGEGDNSELLNWLNRNTYNQLRYIWSVIEKQDSNSVKDVLKMIFTETLFSCSSTRSSKTSSGKIRRHHWGWVADNVQPKNLFEHNAIKIFKLKLLQAIKIINSIKIRNKNSLIDRFDLSVLRDEDARKSSIPSSSVELVVTSPPFIGMTDYVLANRLTYLWMGWPIKDDTKVEIGCRRRRTSQNAEKDYIEDMKKVWKNIHRAMKPDGICAVIIGASRKFPNIIDIFIEQVNNIGFGLIWGPKQRNASRRRVSGNTLINSKEYLCVWHKK